MRKAPSALGNLESRRLKPSMQHVRVASRFVAPPSDVFDAWIDVEIARQWLFATASHRVARLDIDAKLGGRLGIVDVRDESSFEYAGRYLEIVPPRRLVFTLALPESSGVDTCVSVAISALKSGSRLALLHEHLPSALAAGMKMRWTGMFYGLGRLLAARPRGRKIFNRAHCRFEPLPIDYMSEPSSFHHHRSEP